MSFVIDSSKKGSIGQYIKDNLKTDSEIRITSDIFTVYAYNELKVVLDSVKQAKFLFNEPTYINNLKLNKKEVKEFQLQMKKREKALSEFPVEIKLKNNLDQNRVASDFYKFVKEKVEIKSANKFGLIPSRSIYIKNAAGDKHYINGSLNFSMDGLGYGKNFPFHSNTVLTQNIEHYETQFDNIWKNPEYVQDVKSLFLEHLENLYKENSPELIYYLTLYNLFNETLVNLDDIARIKEGTGIHKTAIWNMLYNFQRDGVVGAIKKLELYNGCIIADSVGLGKTYEALAIIKYYELRNQRVLVLTPKKLRTNWTSFKNNSKTNPVVDDRFNYDVLNHTDLSREFGFSGDIDLSKLYWNNYDLIVIDESHNFRNNPSVKDRRTRYQKLMEDVIKSGVKTKVLMLSATPVNNRLTDLKNQIMFITEDDDQAFKDNLNINSISSTLQIAQRRFNEWGQFSPIDQTMENLLPMLDYDFFNLLNTVTIARSRKHIQKYYDTKDIGDFPERLKPISVYSKIDSLDEFPELKLVNNMISNLKLAIYSPLQYVLPTRKKYYEKRYEQHVKDGQSIFKQSDREENLVNLMRINILKRLESSIHSFNLTIKRILEKVNDMHTLIITNNSYTLNIDDEEKDDEDLENLEIGDKIKVELKDVDKIRLKNDLLSDKEILEELINLAENVCVKRDNKLLDLKDKIKHKVKRPINNNNKKIIIFTAFSDTASYLYENIESWAKINHNLTVGLVTGSQIKTNNSAIRNNYDEILARFSPKSHNYETENEIDILIATDVISEGQNLQDCDYLINYDIHWNPVRIIQRFGRIDRIGSKNKEIQLVNFWPNMDLDEYINLESRVKNRMAMVDVSATGEDDLLNPISKELKYRSDQLKQLKEDVVDIEDLTGGISITDLNLDDFIMDLDNFIKKNPGLLENYPTGIHAVTPISDKLINDINPGVIFTLKQRNYLEKDKSENSLYPYHLVYVNNDESIFIKNTNPKKILDIYKSLCNGNDKVFINLANEFNKETKDGNDMSFYTNLLQKGVNDIKGFIEEKSRMSIFNLGKSRIGSNQASSSDDFELVSFLVIKNEK